MVLWRMCSVISQHPDIEVVGPLAVQEPDTLTRARIPVKGAQTGIIGIFNAVVETIVDLGIDWSGIETLSDLKTGRQVAMARVRQHFGEQKG